MSWSLVLGGAHNIWSDLERALHLFGEPDQIVCVKDIWVTYPRVDHISTFHVDRIPRELEKRRALGLPDPKAVWTYSGVRSPQLPFEVHYIKHVRGGSSGLIGAITGTKVADRAVLVGIPLDETMPHFHDRKRNKPWAEGRVYKAHWLPFVPEFTNKVKSMSGYTRELLGEPTRAWVLEGQLVSVG